MESEVTESVLHRYLKSALDAEDPDDKDFYIRQALQHVSYSVSKRDYGRTLTYQHQ